MLLGRCRAQGRHRVGDAGLVQPHDIHVALDHGQAFQVGACLARLVQTVEFPAFVEQRSFGRVHVFRLALIDDATAETQDATAAIADRKHEPVAEPVIKAR